jgi:hypothetical protein
VAGLNLRQGYRSAAFGGGAYPDKSGHTTSDVQHILLLPTGLAEGLGQEVSCPTACWRIRPKKLGPPLLRQLPENSAANPEFWADKNNFGTSLPDVNREIHYNPPQNRYFYPSALLPFSWYIYPLDKYIFV